MQLQHIEKLLSDLGSTANEGAACVAGGYSTAHEGGEATAAVAAAVGVEPLTVCIGSSEMARQIPGLVESIVTMVNKSYGYPRLDRHDVIDRLEMGDPGSSRANRVLHLAMRGNRVLGCMSSTFNVPWAEDGCGHWGLLVVDVEAQGQGIASTLVANAERRLAGTCTEIQIEYEYTHGDPFSDRLKGWYEGKLGFRCASGRSRGFGTEFRKCRKKIPAQAQEAGRRFYLQDIRTYMAAELAQLEGSAVAA